jgi:hypothetical protein
MSKPFITDAMHPDARRAVQLVVFGHIYGRILPPLALVDLAERLRDESPQDADDSELEAKLRIFVGTYDSKTK